MDALPAGIAGAIAAAGGRVTLARFMELALTHPVDGYYSNADTVLGARGDFTTAPALSPEFCDSLARLVEELISGTLSAREGLPGGRLGLIELGGGHGELLRAVLSRLEREQPALKESLTCSVVEVGRELRARQRHALARPQQRGWRVDWVPTFADAVDKGPEAIVAIGNEFIDALPVHVVDVRDDVPREAWIVVGAGKEGGAEGRLKEVWGPITPEVETELETVFGTTEARALRARTQKGVLEVRPAVSRLFDAVAARGLTCSLVTIDYGGWLGAGAPGVPGRGTASHQRTLRGYFRHERVEDVLVRVGRQDITADVDFHALEVHGKRAGFDTVLFTTAAGLLRGDGGEGKLAQLRERAAGSLDADRRAWVLQELLDEESVGGAYRVMLQVKG